MQAVPRPGLVDLVISWGGAFLGILLLAGLNEWFHTTEFSHHFTMLIASFGASAVLVFGVIESKLGQPRNLVGEFSLDLGSA